jgi:hypothetical protein
MKKIAYLRGRWVGAAGLGFGQPAAANLLSWDAGKVGLEIENGGAVEHVETADVQGIAFTAEEFDDGESDGIWAARGAGGEDAVWAVIDGRSAEQLIIFGAVEDPDDEQVREAFDVGEAEGELREDFEEAFGIVPGAWTFGDLLGVVVWTFYMSDGLGRKHGVGSSFDSVYEV